MKKRNALIAVLLIAIGIIVGVALTARMGIEELSLAEKTGVSKESADFLGKLNSALSEVVATVKPSVVNVSTTKTVSIDPFGHFFDDPALRRFFGDMFDFHGPREFRSSSLGSGVIVSEDGYILTNSHVVRDADEIEVTLFNEKSFKGKVVGIDAKTDLAVVKIEEKGLPAAKFGESNDLKAGEVVIAIGVPFGLSETTTMGIVSAVGRSNVGISEYEDFIQTDAAINPGNSGGALVNIKGELVGINTAIFSTSGGYMGIGFAIPSDMAKTVLQSIIKYGKVIRGWLGVTIQDVTPEVAKHFGFEGRTGALVTEVLQDSPAQKSGLKRGDLITQFDGKDIENSIMLKNTVADTPPHKAVKVKVVREGKEKVLDVTLGEYPEKIAEGMRGPARENVLSGVFVQDITPEIRKSLGIPTNIEGVIVTGVQPDSPASGTLMGNDIIREVNRKEIRSVNDYQIAVSAISPGEGVLLLVNRQGGNIYITITP